MIGLTISMFHLIMCFVVTFGWMFYKPLILLIPITFLVWAYTDNKCVITKLEKHLNGDLCVLSHPNKYSYYILIGSFILFLICNFI